MQAAFGETL